MSTRSEAFARFRAEFQPVKFLAVVTVGYLAICAIAVMF